MYYCIGFWRKYRNSTLFSQNCNNMTSFEEKLTIVGRKAAFSAVICRINECICYAVDVREYDVNKMYFFLSEASLPAFSRRKKSRLSCHSKSLKQKKYRFPIDCVPVWNWHRTTSNLFGIHNIGQLHKIGMEIYDNTHTFLTQIQEYRLIRINALFLCMYVCVCAMCDVLMAKAMEFPKNRLDRPSRHQLPKGSWS